MDDQISQTILDNFDVTNVENGQNEINKINAHGGVLRGIEGGALHFITVPNREQEFIDHSFLSPEYIATHIANGFIIDLMNNHDGNDQQQHPHFISEAISNDLEFQNDEHDRKLTATFLQIVNKQCPPVKNGNETQVIVTNKELGTLTDANESAKQNSIDHNFLTIDDQQTFPQSLLSDSQLKIYQSTEPHLNVNPPLPPLTPIRRLNSPRKIANVNNSASTENDFKADSINNFKNNHETPIEDTIVQRPLGKRSLPHKKRITKKLKTIDKQLEQHQAQCHILYSEEPEDTVEEESIVLNTQQFACQLCGQLSESQLHFFAHLKEHYEPVGAEVQNERAAAENAKKDEQPPLIEPTVELNFEGFDDEILNQSKHDENDDQHSDVKIIEVGSSSNDASAKDVDINVTEVEFSDTEDMLEGIRGVVDKVQESVDNDTNDGIEMSEKTWYTISALNGDINFKNGVAVNSHITQQSVDNFSLFLKSDLVKGAEPSENILPTLEEDDISGHEDKSIESKINSNSELSKQETAKPKKKRRKTKTRKDDSRDHSENGDTSESEDKLKSKKRIQCTKCNKLFNSTNALKYHDLSHTGERPHQCSVCGKSFFALSALKVHMRLHSGLKPYECEFCKRAFRQWGDLKYHKISIHTNEKNFQCEFCGKAFARRYSLVVHRRIHTSEKNYKCEFCPKSFRASSYLQNHRKVHTGEKPYSCKICGKKFRVSGDLKRHVNIHNRDRRKTKPTNSAAGLKVQLKQESASSSMSNVKKELASNQQHPHNSKTDSEVQINRTASLTIFYPEVSIDLFKAEPPTFDQTPVSDLQEVDSIDSMPTVSVKKHKDIRKMISIPETDSLNGTQSDKSLPIRTEDTDTGDLSKMLQKGSSLVYFW